MKGRSNQKGSILLVISVLIIFLLAYLGFAGAVIGSYEVKSFDKVITKGLDLEGGSSTVLKIESDSEEISEETLRENKEVIEKRLTQMDVDNSNVEIEGENSIRVNMRNNVKTDSIIERLTHNGKLEVKDEEDNIILTEKDVKEAEYIVNEYSIEITLALTEEGKSTFAEFTKNNIDKSIKIFLDGSSISTETIDEAITNGELKIKGLYDLAGAEKFVDLINSGTIIGTVTAEETESVGPALGENAYSNITKGLAIGISVIFLLIIAYYKIPGLLGSVSILLNITLILIAYTESDLAFTKYSLAALVFSIAISILSNILILDKISRQIPLSKNLKSAAVDGFEKANPIIFKTNVIIFIISVISYYLVPLSIKSPAAIILMGSISTAICSLFVTKLLLKLAVNSILKNKKQFKVKKA